MHYSDTPVAEWTLDECSEYVAQGDEIEGESRAEFGSGAVSLGYNGSEAMAHYDGYRSANDPKYVEARRRLDEARPAPVVTECNCDAPFDRCSHGLGDIPF